MVVVRKCFALFQIKFAVCYQAALKYAVKQICVVNLNEWHRSLDCQEF